MQPARKPLTAGMKVTVALLATYAAGIVLAVFQVPEAARVLALTLVGPVLLLSLVFAYYAAKRRPWSFAGAVVLGVFGVALRLVVNTMPDLEPPGGVPVAVTAVYLVLGSLLALGGLLSFTESKRG